MNVDLDEPLPSRKAFLERLRLRHGALRRDGSEPVESATPYHATWWLAGEQGRARVEILLSPELPPRIQTFSVTSVPAPSSRLQEAAERIVAAIAPPESGPVAIDWPADLTVGEDVNVGAIVRSMRATEARFGPVSLGPPIAGDGETKASFRLTSPRGQVDLVLELDPQLYCLSSVLLVPGRQEPPNLV
jgi:hypothetical protein